MRIYPVEARIDRILERARELSFQQHGKLDPDHSVDIPALQDILSTVDHAQVHKRRAIYNRLYHEALVIEEAGRGISFTNMLLLLAHYKIIEDDKALKFVLILNLGASAHIDNSTESMRC